MGDSWKERAIKKRDFKHDPTEPKMVNHSKKDTVRWCKGRVGTHHDYDFVKFWTFSSIMNWPFSAYADYRCKNCDKQTYVQLTKELIDG